MTEKPTFDPSNPDRVLLKQAVLSRLKADPQWKQFDAGGSLQSTHGGFEHYLTILPRHDGQQAFDKCLLDIFWELVNEGVVAPGINLGPYNCNFPWFHLTPYGREVVNAGGYTPHDTTGYLLRLQQRVNAVDPTVRVYLEESLSTFLKGNLIASTVMLGVAAERVFLLLCESIRGALADATEKSKFEKMLEKQAMRPKLTWVDAKFRLWQEGKTKVTGFPDNAALMVTTLYDLARVQRNDAGHPRELPPKLDRGNAYASLEVFPIYYETAERIRSLLKTVKV